MVDRIPPYNIDSEEALLGSLLIDNEAIRKIVNGIDLVDFYSERNKWIYESCLSIYERHDAINQITVAQELASKDKLVGCGGGAFLSHLISICPTSLDVEYYAEIVHRLSVYRQMIIMSDQIATLAYAGNPEQGKTVSKVDELWGKFKKQNTMLGNGVVTPLKAANDVFLLWETLRSPVDYPQWGYYDMDSITAGIAPEYVVIAGRPSSGKTQLALDLMENLNIQGKIVLLASAEMSDTQIYERKLSRVTGLSILDIRKNGIPTEKEKAVLDLVGEMSESHVNYLHGKLFLSDVYREIYNLLSKGKLDAVFIDYLGALQDCYVDGRDNVNVKIGKISNTIQAMVHEFNVPIITLAQLNRDIEKRADAKPLLSDLRDSGSIEQDADVIFFLHREKLDDGSMSKTLEMTMAKNRQIGAKPPIKLLFNSEINRYVDMYDERNTES